MAMGPRRTLVVDGSVVEGAASLEGQAWWRGAWRPPRRDTRRTRLLFSARHPRHPRRPRRRWIACAYPPRGQGAAFLARLLQFFETPPYLRRALMPRHPDLAMVGALPRHHPSPPERACAPCPTTSKSTMASPPRGRGGSRKNPVRSGKSTLADVGLGTPVALDRAVKVGVRVTVELPDKPPTTREKVAAVVVSPRTPPRAGYWGFDVRLANAAEDHPAAETHEDEGVRYRLVASTR